MNFPWIILNSLCTNSEYTQQVIHHIKPEYFESYSNREIFNYIKNYVEEFNTTPTKSILQYEISKSTKYHEKQFSEINKTLDEIFKLTDKNSSEWLVKETEKFCKDVSFENALVEAFQLYEQDKKNKQVAHELILESLKVSFNNEVGINFFNEDHIKKRHQNYNNPDVIYKTGFETFDAACGGLCTKELTTIMAFSGIGKTLTKVAIGANCLKQGYNVAYFTMEMSEEKIAQRFDANLLNIEMDEVRNIKEDKFVDDIKKVKSNAYGELRIKEFPSKVTVKDIERILDEWKLMDGFAPHILIVDYLNELNSYIVKNDNSYNIVKSIAQELRGLCVRKGYAGLTSTQTNREGNNAQKHSANSISESIGTVYVSGLIIALISNEKMVAEKYQVWQIVSKNRNTGILNFFFPMRVDTLRSKVEDAWGEIEDVVLLNNNPLVLERVEKLKLKNLNYDNKKFNEGLVKLRKKNEMNFDKEEDDNFLDNDY